MEIFSIQEFYLSDKKYPGVRKIETPPYDLFLFDIPRQVSSKFINKKLELFLNRSVVYILFDKSLSANGRRNIYIGKSSIFQSQILNHLQNKTFWTNVLVFTSYYFNESAIKYIEDKLTKISKENDSLNVKTERTQPSGQYREHECLLYDKYCSIILELLQRQKYWSKNSVAANSFNQTDIDINNSETFSISHKSLDEPQKMYVLGDQYIVKKGTKISKIENKSLERPYGPLNRKLIENGIISREDGEFLKDYSFESPSAAACIIIGSSANGQKIWKNAAGVSLGEL